MKHSTIKRNFALNPAVIRFNCNKHQSLFFADFRRLAEKKALASSRNSFSSFKRQISLSCSLTRFLSAISSSLRDNAVLGEWTASFALRRPSLKALIQVYIVPFGIPNSLAALCPPISWLVLQLVP